MKVRKLPHSPAGAAPSPRARCPPSPDPPPLPVALLVPPLLRCSRRGGRGHTSPPGREGGRAVRGRGGAGGCGALTSHEDLQQLRHQQQRVAVNCEDRALRGGWGERRGGPASAGPPPRTSRPPVSEVQPQQPLHRLLRGESSGEAGRDRSDRGRSARFRSAPS